MDKHEQKHCLRCGTAFECKPGSINQCQCSEIQLSVAERVYIESKHEDCLCVNCLEALRQEYIVFNRE